VITGLDHIAIAVSDIDAAIARFLEDFGIPMSGREDVLSEQTGTAFFPLPGTRIELVTPLDGQGPIAASIARRGEGMHHICFRSDDLDADVERLRGKGYRFTSEQPRPGAHGTRVIFVHPKSAGGVLIELAEHPEAEPHA
jgi:methylmalonyl-CoA/ethylmalonyl-CoA epimerase